MSEEEVKQEEEMVDYQDKYLRLLAENENMRKRMQKEKQDMMRFAVGNVLEEFLTPLDNFEKALGFQDQMSAEVKNWAMGFEMILTQLKDVLHEQGIKSFTSVGETFDPNRHDAVEVEETDEHEENTILEEFVRGYQLGDRILRAARVKVAKKPTIKEEEE